MARYGKQAAPQVRSTLAKLALCRTKALGGRRLRCEGCARECVVYNSCGDRHCPLCAGARRADWVASAEALLLEGVDHYQVVFTLPTQLSSLALGNRRAIYNLLFSAAWSALQQTIASEQGYEAAALMTLHTWNQRLEAHGHVHAVVPGGGPALDGSGWKTSSRNGRCLVDAVSLRRAFRERFIAGLDRLRTQRALRLEGDFTPLQADEPWQEFLHELRGVEWVSHIQGPPRDAAGRPCPPQQAVKYLARYLTGGPLSDARIIAADPRSVTFWARTGKTTGGERKSAPCTLSTGEFVRRWCLHILPRGFTKTRRFGGWSNRRREAYLERCAVLMDAAAAPVGPHATDFPPDDPSSRQADLDCPAHDAGQTCPQCGGRLAVVEETTRPAWRDVFATVCRGDTHVPLARPPGLSLGADRADR